MSTPSDTDGELPAEELPAELRKRLSFLAHWVAPNGRFSDHPDNLGMIMKAANDHRRDLAKVSKYEIQRYLDRCGCSWSSAREIAALLTGE